MWPILVKKNPKPNSAYNLHKLLDFKAWGRFCDTKSHKELSIFCTNPSALAKESAFSRMSFPCTRDLAHGFSLVLSPLQPFASAISPSNLTSPLASYCFLSPEISLYCFASPEIRNSVSWLEIKKKEVSTFLFPPFSYPGPTVVSKTIHLKWVTPV